MSRTRALILVLIGGCAADPKIRTTSGSVEIDAESVKVGFPLLLTSTLLAMMVSSLRLMPGEGGGDGRGRVAGAGCRMSRMLLGTALCFDLASAAIAVPRYQGGFTSLHKANNFASVFFAPPPPPRQLASNWYCGG